MFREENNCVDCSFRGAECSCCSLNSTTKIPICEDCGEEAEFEIFFNYFCEECLYKNFADDFGYSEKTLSDFLNNIDITDEDYDKWEDYKSEHKIRYPID